VGNRGGVGDRGRGGEGWAGVREVGGRGGVGPLDYCQVRGGGEVGPIGEGRKKGSAVLREGMADGEEER